MISLVLIGLLIPFFAYLLRKPSIRARLSSGWTAMRRGLLAMGVALVCLTLVCILVGVSADRMELHDEPTVLSITAAFHHGQPMYPSVADPVEYGLLYGPATYLVYLPPMLGGAERVWMYQAWVLLALGGTFAFTWLAFRERMGRSIAIGSVAYVAIFVTRFQNFECGIKGDGWILLFSAMGLWAAFSLRPWLAALVLAIAGGMLLDLKATVAFIALLPCVLLWQRERAARVPALCGAILIPLFALVPFAIPGISLAGYSNELRDAAHHGLIVKTLLANIYVTVLLFLPAIALFRMGFLGERKMTLAWLRQRGVFLVALGASAVVAIVTGAKVGAGTWHCLVFLIPVTVVNGDLWQIAMIPGAQAAFSSPRRASAFLAVALVLLQTALAGTVTGLRHRLQAAQNTVEVSMLALESDLMRISDRHPGKTLQMGYSDIAHYPWTFLRSVLIIRGNPLLLDANARNEASLLGRPIAPPLISALQHCSVGIWILPRGGEPFSMENLYALEGQKVDPILYPEGFRQAFLANYQRTQSESSYFDLWECRPVTTSSALKLP